MRYVVRKPYQSHVGRYEPGQVLELEDELAAWMLRDLPGCIALIPEPQAAPVETHVAMPSAETHMVDVVPKRKARGKK